MAAQGLDVKDQNEIRRLKSLGFGKRKISRTLGIHRDTVSKYFDVNLAIATLPPNAALNILALDETSADESWTASVDWQAVRLQALQGVPINIIY